MKKKTKKIIKIILIPIIVFILGNIGIYVYCFLTPKMEINKSQSYYLYDNESKLVSQTNDEWIRTRTGIRQRYQCEEESCQSLAIAAAKDAYAKAAGQNNLTDEIGIGRTDEI